MIWAGLLPVHSAGLCWVVLGVKNGWLLQEASYPPLILLGLNGVCSKWLPESRVLISAMLGRVAVKGRRALDSDPDSGLAVWRLKVTWIFWAAPPAGPAPCQKKQRTHTQAEKKAFRISYKHILRHKTTTAKETNHPESCSAQTNTFLFFFKTRPHMKTEVQTGVSGPACVQLSPLWPRSLTSLT